MASEFRLVSQRNKSSPPPTDATKSGAPARPSLLPTSSEAATSVRRLSWRRRVGPAARRRPLVRAETFDSGQRATRTGQIRPDARSSAAERRESGEQRKRLDVWLDQFEQAGRAKWSSEPSARGRYGESLVHVLLINHSDEHILLLVLLLKLFPALIGDTMQSVKFFGIGCLHLAIAHGNERLLAHLLELLAAESGDALIGQRVTGSLFRSPLELEAQKWPTKRPAETKFWCDQQQHWPAANGLRHLILNDRIKRAANSTQAQQAGDDSNPEKTIYFGQTPLAWSVAFDSRDMFELLVSRGGVDVLESRDHQDNNCLHQLIINSQQNWTRFLLKSSPRLARQLNSMQLTPFLLACHLGRVELFNELLELSAVEFWTYSSVKCCAYPLANLDPIVMQQRASSSPSRPQRELKSAVSVILESKRSSDEQKAALLSTGVIKKLLEEKWAIFARRLFYTDLTLTLLQLILMTFACFTRPARIKSNYLQELEAVAVKASELSFASPAGHLKLPLSSHGLDKLDLVRPQLKSRAPRRSSSRALHRKLKYTPNANHSKLRPKVTQCLRDINCNHFPRQALGRLNRMGPLQEFIVAICE